MQNINGYATTTGCRTRLGRFKIPVEWWSRKFEYPWVAHFIAKDDVVLDAGCGIPHFFKYWLADNCKSVVALDGDIRILDLKNIPDNMTLTCARLTDLPYQEPVFDKIVCVSVLEHTGKAMGRILEEFNRVLKLGGSVILTLDVPTITVSEWRRTVAASPFTFEGKVDWEEPRDILVEPDVIHTPDGKCAAVGGKGRRVFCSVLRKENE